MLKLKHLLRRLRSTQADLAAYLGVSGAAVAQIVNHGEWPRSMDKGSLMERTRDFLRARGANEEDLTAAFEAEKPEVDGPRVLADAAARPGSQSSTNDDQEVFMLLRKQVLTQAAKEYFRLSRDPFKNDILSHEDLFLSPDVRYVREAMFQTAKHGGFLAVVGESGAGKTTLIRDLEDRIMRENHPIIVTRPYVLAMEDDERKGKTLKSSHITEALMAAVAPLEKPKSSPQARNAQLHKALLESHTAGYRHCLVIDEAHALAYSTIKHLKRFWDLEIGHTKLLSIVLVGQPELHVKLSERNPEVREVVQRCEIAELVPLGDGRLEEYLKFKFARQGKALSDVIDAGGIAELRARLEFKTTSLLYPLAVANLLTAAMNFAEHIKAPRVTADVVKGV